MISSLTFAKNVINLTKLDNQLKEDATTGPLYMYLTKQNGEVTLLFSDDLTQAIINQASAIVNDFVEVNLYDVALENVEARRDVGGKIYHRLVARINVDGNVYTGIDQGLAVYPNFFVIRNLLLDGFLEFALRYLIKTIGPAEMVSAEQLEFARVLIRTAAKGFGVTDAYLDSIETEETI